MTKLVIRKPGFFINIPGITPFRTPAKIDISRIDIKLIISCLNKNGIIEYEIEDEEIKPVSKIETIINTPVESKEIIEDNSLLNKFLNPNFKVSEIE